MWRSSHLEYCGMIYEGPGNLIVVQKECEPVLAALFDQLNRLTKLEATIKPRRES